MDILRDFMMGWRALRRGGGPPTFAVLMLALAIGASTSVFSILEAVLLRPLPFHDPATLVMLWGRDDARDSTVVEVSLGDLREWREQTKTLTAIEVFGSVNWSYRVTAPGEPFTATYSSVSGSFFDTLGARPQLGRTFRPDDDRAGAPGTVVLSADLWRRRFSADPGIVGRTITIGEGAEARPFEVIGVMGPEFRFPAGAELWAPAIRDMGQFAQKNEEQLGDLDNLRVFYALGRLRGGATPGEAEAELSAIARRREIGFGDTDSRMRAVVTPLLTHFFGSARPAILAIAGGVALLLLIACANAASLLLLRGVAREREFAIRLALGAGRWDLVRQVLSEAAVLAVLAGVLGVAIASASFDAVVALAPLNVPRLDQASISGPVLLFAIAVCGLTVLLVGLWPAWQLSSTGRFGALQQSSRTGAAPRTGRTRKVLVVVQLAAAVVLLAASGLLSRSFLALMRIDLGFDSRNVLTFDIHVPELKYATPERQRTLAAALVEALEQLPDVSAAGAIYQRPFAHGPIGMDSGVILEGQPLQRETSSRNPILNWQSVTPGYFRAMDIRLMRGRPLTDADDERAPLSVLVSDGLARRLWPGQDPIGKRLLAYGSGGDGEPRWQTVVGVVEDARYREIQEARFDLYLPFRQAPSPVKHYVVRTAGDPWSIVPVVKEALKRVEPELTVEHVTTMEQIVAGTMAPWRFNTIVFGAFSVVALAFAAIGVAALMGYAVRQRTREIGVRMALGARAVDVVRLVLREGAQLTGAGLVIGMAAAWVLTQAIAGLLFGVAPNDPVTFAVVALLLVLVSLLAAYVPARRAASIDPALVLRSD